MIRANIQSNTSIRFASNTALASGIHVVGQPAAEREKKEGREGVEAPSFPSSSCTAHSLQYFIFYIFISFHLRSAVLI